jgi:hypothetical protein
MGPSQYPRLGWPGQERCLCRPRPYGCRRCLLKGCERWFRPGHPRACYCSPACQKAARQWQRWHASRRYRATDQGKTQRRGQSQRRRHRIRQGLTTAAVAVASGEGQRVPAAAEKSSGQPCDRPGCYELFVSSPRCVQQRFCSCSCRQALRRVRQRDLRWAERRHRGRPRRQPPPQTPPGRTG